MSANVIAENTVDESGERFGNIAELVHAYFQGLHFGDVKLLAAVFDAGAWLQSAEFRLSRDEWLDRVAARQSPEELGHTYEYEILALDVDRRHGVAKLRVPLLGKTYVDYLSLLKEGDRWRVVNKLYLEA